MPGNLYFRPPGFDEKGYLLDKGHGIKAMSIKKNFIYNFLLTGSNILFPLLTFPYLSRVIGASGLGICNFIISYAENYIIIAALGLPIYGIREIARMSEKREKRSQLFYELLSIHLLFTFFLLGIYLISIFLHEDFQNYKQLSYLGALYILTGVFRIEWLFSGVNDFKYITIRSLIIRSLSVAAIFLFVKEKMDFNIYFMITVLTNVITAIVNLNYAKKYIGKFSRLTIKGIRSHVKAITILGFYMVITNIYTVLPQTLLGFLSTKVAVGYYFAANKIVRMTITVFTALSTVMIPRLNQLLEDKGKEEYLTLIDKALNIVVSLGIPLAFLVYLMAEPLVNLLAGSEFQNSIYLVEVMSPAILFVALAQVFVLMILSVNRKDREMVILAITGMVVSLVINLVFIPRYAERATAWAELMAELVVSSLAFIWAYKYLRFRFPIKRFMLNLVLVVPFYPIVILSNRLTNNLFLLLIIPSVAIGIYYLLYQFFIIRNELFIELSRTYINKLLRRE